MIRVLLGVICGYIVMMALAASLWVGVVWNDR